MVDAYNMPVSCSKSVGPVRTDAHDDLLVLRRRRRDLAKAATRPHSAIQFKSVNAAEV